MGQTILITGASSGIGQTLAEHYAGPNVTLILNGRNEERLQQVAHSCTLKGATVLFHVLDVTDQLKMKEWIELIDSKHPIDLVIANAGIGRGQRPDTREVTDKILNINLYGVLNTVLPVIPLMRKRGRGHLAIMSSLAAYRAFPGRGPYSASKAALLSFCEDWRLSLIDAGIHVTAICPGFVKTPLTDQNIHRMPFKMTVEKAVRIITKGLAKKKAIIAFPRLSFLFMKILQAMPARLSDYIIAKVSNQQP